MNYSRSLNELETKAIKWWPTFLTDAEGTASILPLLIATQEQFLSILKLSSNGPAHYLEVLKASAFPANLFLKHLVVLADFGGEPLQRLNRDFGNIFPYDSITNKYYFNFIWNGNEYKYDFKELPANSSLTNAKMKIDGRSLLNNVALDNLISDVATLIMYGASATDGNTSSILSKCEIGTLLGNVVGLDKFVKERYLHVSRITGGAQANTLGQVAQSYVSNYLRESLGNGYSIESNGHIEGVTQNDGRTLTTFDLVVSRGTCAVAIEISFQVTTNSTIERKAGQAVARIQSLHRNGNYIAYILDGAGNFQRASALKTICENSDCTVAYSNCEFDLLVQFIREKLT